MAKADAWAPDGRVVCAVREDETTYFVLFDLLPWLTPCVGHSFTFTVDKLTAEVGFVSTAEPRRMAATTEVPFTPESIDEKTVTSFRGPHLALSNFAPFPTMLDGILYPTSQHAFVAAKSSNPEIRAVVRSPPTAEANAYGRTIDSRADWDDVRDDVMLAVVRDKFARNPDAASVLLSTEDRALIDGNDWHDNYWGMCKCPDCAWTGFGRNTLGRLLEQVRGETLLRSE